jgi:hypothetical protein
VPAAVEPELLSDEVSVLKMTPKFQLDDILSNGIQIDLYRAEQCLALREVIAEHANEINGASFGDLFGNLQRILYQFAMLSMAKVFEIQTPRYPLRSIHAALTVLKDYGSALALQNKHSLIEALVQFGHDEKWVNPLSDAQLTELLHKEYKCRLPQPDESSSDDMSKTLYAIKTLRDKFISHSEAIKIEDLPDVPFGGVTNLIQFAQKFLTTVGRTYLSVSYTLTAGKFMKTTDAAGASRGLERLLETAGIIGEAETQL